MEATAYLDEPGGGLSFPGTRILDTISSMGASQPVYLRVGDWHPSETSRNYAEGGTEAGVSVYRLHDGHPVTPEGDEESADIHARLAGDDPKHLVTGREVGTGAQGEPLLRDVRHVGEYEAPAGGHAPGYVRGVGEVMHRVEAAARPPRGHATCSCCHGNGEHQDGTECHSCQGLGHRPQTEIGHCDGQPNPRRRHWRTHAAVGMTEAAFEYPLAPGHLGEQGYRVTEESRGSYKGENWYTYHMTHPSGESHGHLDVDQVGRYNDPEREVHVQDLHIPKEHEGKGIASALMDHVYSEHPEPAAVTHSLRTEEGGGWWDRYTAKRPHVLEREHRQHQRAVEAEDDWGHHEAASEQAPVPEGHMRVEDLLDMQSTEALRHHRRKMLQQPYHEDGSPNNGPWEHGNHTRVRTLYDRKAGQMAQHEHAWSELDEPIRSGGIDPVLLEGHGAGGTAVSEGHHRIIRAHQLGVATLPVSRDPGSQRHRDDWEDPEEREEPQQHTAARQAPIGWDEVGARHPHIYGDPEVHGEDAEGGDGEGVGWAANHLANDRPDDPDAENSGAWDMYFHHEKVDPRHIDYARHGLSDGRVRHAYEGYKSGAKVPPLVLVHRHGVYQVADGHHRAEGAAEAGKHVDAYVHYSEHPDEPFSAHEDEGERRAPFHGAEPHPGVDEHRHFFHRKAAADSSYMMRHRGPTPEETESGEGEALHQLGHGPLFPDNVLTHPHIYGARHPETTRQIRSVKGDPEARVTIYRGLPKEHHSINQGDWVGLSAGYASGHADSEGQGKYHVLKAQVPAKHVHSEGNSLEEWTYNGPDIPHAEQHHPGRTAALPAASSSPLAPVNDAVTEHLAGFQPQSARDMRDFYAELPGTVQTIADALHVQAARIRHELPLDGDVGDYVTELGSMASAMTEMAHETNQVFRRVHAVELARLEAPREGEEAWNLDSSR
jgi:hypothetical protein